MPKRPSSGFTIVELLVSIAVMAVLIAMLIPAIIRSRESVRQALCANRMRYIFIANEGYRADTRYHTAWIATNFDPSVNNLAGTIQDWTFCRSWAAQLMEGEYIPRYHMLARNDPNCMYDSFWEVKHRQQSTIMCPSGLYFGVPTGNRKTFGSIGSRAYPDGVGVYNRAAADVVDYHIWEYPKPNWLLFTDSNNYALTMTSYNMNRNTSDLVTINGIDGYVQMKELRTTKSTFTPNLTLAPANITLYNEQSYQLASREHNMNNEKAYEASWMTGSYYFRIPHVDTANYVALDGHVATVARKYFGPLSNGADVANRPFIW